MVCHNEEQARKDRADRAAIVAALKDQLRRGEKSLVGNRGYRKYLRSAGRHWDRSSTVGEGEMALAPSRTRF